MGPAGRGESEAITEAGARIEHSAQVLEDRLRLAGTVDHAFRRHIQRRRFHLGESEAEQADGDVINRRPARKECLQVLCKLAGARFELEARERRRACVRVGCLAALDS